MLRSAKDRGTWRRRTPKAGRSMGCKLEEWQDEWVKNWKRMKQIGSKAIAAQAVVDERWQDIERNIEGASRATLRRYCEQQGRDPEAEHSNWHHRKDDPDIYWDTGKDGSAFITHEMLRRSKSVARARALVRLAAADRLHGDEAARLAAIIRVAPRGVQDAERIHKEAQDECDRYVARQRAAQRKERLNGSGKACYQWCKQPALTRVHRVFSGTTARLKGATQRRCESFVDIGKLFGKGRGQRSTKSLPTTRRRSRRNPPPDGEA